MRNHYDRNMDEVFQYMTKDVVWIGPLDFQWANSAEQMKEILIPEYGLRCIMTDEEYALAAKNKDMWVTYGRYTVSTNDKANIFVQLKCRFTFVWKKIENSLKIVHLHVSQSYDYPRGRKTTYKQGQNPFEYVAHIIENTSNEEKLSFRDIQGRLHYLRESEIIYVVADNLCCKICHVNGEFTVRIKISQLEQRLSKNFIKIHRSYLVNINAIQEMERFRLKVYNNIWLPIPARKYPEIREKLNYTRKE